MYVYQPGSGFSGEAKLVPPGCEFGEMSNSWSDLKTSTQCNFVDSGVVTSTSFECKPENSEELYKVETVTCNR